MRAAPSAVSARIRGSAGTAPRSGWRSRRRVFWLLPYDRDTEPEGPYVKSAPPPKQSTPAMQELGI
ncbi:DUF6009 family protein [Streptomyces canus]|uniref:DUF6009 family protein n=1 Tax=Streptomyces canus TaxID=58343 RepID=UPI0036E92994